MILGIKVEFAGKIYERVMFVRPTKKFLWWKCESDNEYVEEFEHLEAMLKTVKNDVVTTYSARLPRING